MKEKQISLRLSNELYSELEKIAKQKELPTTGVIRMVLREFIENNNNKNRRCENE